MYGAPQLPSYSPLPLPRGGPGVPEWLNEPGLEPQYPLEEALLGVKIGELGAGVLGRMMRRASTKRLVKQVGRMEDLVTANAKLRAKRLIAQEPKWLDQSPRLRQALETVEDRLSMPYSNGAGGRFKGVYETKLDWDELVDEYLPMNSEIEVPYKPYAGDKRRAGMVARHETGHYYRNSPQEGLDWGRVHDIESAKKIARNEVEVGNDYPDRISDYFRRNDAVELRERAAQLKDFIAERKGIGYDVDFPVEKGDLDWAIDNYLKRRHRNYDNNMKEYLGSIVDRDQLLYNMNRYALGVVPPVAASRMNTYKDKK